MERKSIVPAPGDADYIPQPHQEGAVYYIDKNDGGGDILTNDFEGNEFPAPDGYYFQQWLNGEPVGGYFGPYPAVSDMPDYVRENLA